jgi:hypothetical protein
MDLIQLVKNFVTTWFNENLHGLFLAFFFINKRIIYLVGWVDCHAGIIHVVFIITLFLLIVFIYFIYLFHFFCWLVGFVVF